MLLHVAAHLILILIESIFRSGAVVSCQDVLSNPVVELTVRPGDNVTLYCDCKLATKVNLVWYRNCSHENQPTLSLNWEDRDQGIFYYGKNGTNFFHLNMMWNDSSNSFDLLIKNITDSHLGLYYCGTEELNGEKGNKKEYIYTYGKIITRILFGKLTIFVVKFINMNSIYYHMSGSYANVFQVKHFLEMGRMC